LKNRIIPLFDSPDFKQAVILDGVNYVLRIQWNTRCSFWTMSIFDGNETIVRAGIKLVPMYPLRAQYNDPRLPPGEFVLVDTSQSANQEIGRHDFGTGRNVELWYVGVTE
jgi:hypothetical protein